MKNLQKLAYIITTLGTALVVLFLIKSFNDGYSIFTLLPTDYTTTGQFGDFVGGVVGTFFALAGTLLIFISFVEQTKENKRIAFESSFFEMIRLHRENVSELRYHKSTKNSETVFENRQVTNLIFKEFIECYRDVKKFSNSKNVKDYIRITYINDLKKIIESINPQIDLIELAIIDIAWTVVFYGLSVEGESVIKKNFGAKYNSKYYYKLLFYLKLKPKKTNKLRFNNWIILRGLELSQLHPLINELYSNRIHPERAVDLSEDAKNLRVHLQYEKYYGGHQFRLGHYFRHLFQSYTYLNEHPGLKESDRYFYGKLLRAQLSTYEQALLFINSISSLGMKWEFTSVKNNGKASINNLITKYNLIKNLPDDHMYGIKYKKYYKNVSFEFDEK